MFYLSISMLADHYLLIEERMGWPNLLVGSCFIGAWYMEGFLQVVMSANRFTIITLNKHNIFTHKFTFTLFFFLVSAAICSVISNQFLFPCCQFIVDQELMVVLYVDVDNMYSYSNLMNKVYSISAASIASFFYFLVLNTIRKTTKIVSSSISKQNQKRDIRYLLQFLFILIFYILAFVFYETMAIVVPPGHEEWYFVLTLMVILNCSSNPIVYLSLNNDIRRKLKNTWCCALFQKSQSSSLIFVLPAGHANTV
ncbi:unnamed protein product [Caenorhabditis nigoni]